MDPRHLSLQVFQAVPGEHLLLLPDDPVFTIVAASDDYLRARGIARQDLVGASALNRFTNETDSEGVRELIASLRRAVATGNADQIAVQQKRAERQGSVLNRPIREANDQIEYILHTATFIPAVRPQASAEEKLAQTNLRNTEILESITDCFLAFDQEWRFVYVNAAAERIMGASRQDLLGRNHWDIFPASLGTVVEHEYRRAVREGTPVEFESFYEPWQRWFAIKGYPTQQRGLSVYFQDITERKAAHALLQDNADRFTMAFAEAPVGMLLTTPEGRIVEVNRAYQNMLGFSRDELVSQDLAHFTHPEDIIATRQFFASLKHDSWTTSTIEKRYIRKNGQFLWARASATMRRDNQGRPTQFVAIVEDITESKRARDGLRESQERLRAIYDGTYEYICLLAPDGTLLEANRASLEFAGNTREQVIGLPFWQSPWFAYTPGEPEVVRQAVIRAAAGEFVRYEATLRRPSGELTSFDISLHPVRNERGEVVLIVPEGREITERKAVERRDAFLVRLNDATRPLTDPQEIMQTAARLLGEHLGMDRCVYCTFQPDEETLDITSVSMHSEVPPMSGRYKLTQFGKDGVQLFRASLPWIVEDTETDPGAADGRDTYRQSGIRAHASVPLQKAGRLMAAMGFHQLAPRRWRPEEVELVQQVANRCWESIERARAEASLRQQWHTFDTALSHTPDFTYIFDLDGRFTYVNRSLLALWQRSLEDSVGKTFFELGYPPELAARLQRQIQQVIDTKQPVRDQTPFTALTGETRHYEYIFVPVFSAHDQVEAVAGSTRDVTDRNQAAQQIEQDRERWRELLRQTPAGIAILRGPEHKFEWVNDDYLRLVGRKAEALIGKTVIAALPEVDGQVYMGLLNNVYRTGEPFQGHESLVRLGMDDGILRDAYIDFVYVPIRNTAGEIEGIYAHATDVTAMVLARKQVEESEQQFRTLAETIPHLAWMADETGHIFWYNRRWYDYTGTTLAEMEGWGWQKVHDPAALPGVVTEWTKSISTGEPFQMVFPLKSFNGEFRSFLTRVEPVKDSQGRVARWFGTNTDITDQRKTEDELRRTNRELEEFAYVASHDLQEPLRMVNIYTHLILRTLPEQDPKLSQYTAFVRQGVNRMEALIHDLLTFSRTVHTDQEPVGTADLAASLGEAISVLKNRIEETGAVITAQPFPAVRGDTAQIAHVFQNLISNSLKYHNNDIRPEIQISAERNGGQCTVSVRDNGIGFDPRYAERIFGLFKRLHKEAYPGTGLGLAICQRIIERYGGRMWAEGRPGEGATLYFALPCATEDPGEGSESSK